MSNQFIIAYSEGVVNDIALWSHLLSPIYDYLNSHIPHVINTFSDNHPASHKDRMFMTYFLKFKIWITGSRFILANIFVGIAT